MREGFSPGNYPRLVDFTARLFRQSKARLSREVSEIRTRLNTDGASRQSRLEHLRRGRRLPDHIAKGEHAENALRPANINAFCRYAMSICDQ